MKKQFLSLFLITAVSTPFAIYSVEIGVDAMKAKLREFSQEFFNLEAESRQIFKQYQNDPWQSYKDALHDNLVQDRLRELEDKIKAYLSKLPEDYSTRNVRSLLENLLNSVNAFEDRIKR